MKYPPRHAMRWCGRMRGVSGSLSLRGRAANDLAPLEGIPYDGVVSLNGARCVAADGRVVSQHLIPRADFERAMELSSQMGFPLALELERGVFVNRVTPEVERLAHMVAHPVPEQTDLRALFERSECCQMCFYLDTEAERRVMAQLPGLRRAGGARFSPTSMSQASTRPRV